MFHQQLAYCTTQFVEKDPQTAEPVILGLLKYWPVTASAKEVRVSLYGEQPARQFVNWFLCVCPHQILFLNELEEIIELVQVEQFAVVLRPLFLRMAHAVCSSHFQVSQRALYLWNNESLVRLVSARRAEVLPLIFGALYRNCESHWHRCGLRTRERRQGTDVDAHTVLCSDTRSTVQTLTYNVLKLFMEMDSQLFDQCSAQLEEREGRCATLLSVCGWWRRCTHDGTRAHLTECLFVSSRVRLL